MKTWLTMIALAFVCNTVIVSTALAAPNRVRVINKTDSTIYIHKGGFAPSVKIPTGQWKIFYYPFYVVPPNSSKKIASTKIIATAGGRWMTTANGLTYLRNPTLCIVLDYNTPEHRAKKGNRVWTIKRATGIDPNCKIVPYQQPWYQEQ